MTSEEVKAFLSSEEGKQLFNEIAKENRYLHPSEIDGLVKTKESILAEKKKLQEELKKYKELDSNELDQKVSTLEERELELKREKEEFELIRRLNSKKQGDSNSNDSLFSNIDEIKKYKSDLQKEQKALESRYEKKLEDYENKHKEEYNKLYEEYNYITAKYDNERIENTINKHFDEVGVAEAFRPVLKEAIRIKAKAKYNEDTNNRDIVFLKKDSNVELELSPKEFFNDFVNSEENKVYIQAPKNGGGGAIGSQSANGKSGKVMSSEGFYNDVLNNSLRTA